MKQAAKKSKKGNAGSLGTGEKHAPSQSLDSSSPGFTDGHRGHSVNPDASERDITARLLNEKNLRRFATVVLDSNDAITIQDFEGRITAWNRGAEVMYGYSEEEALLMNIEVLTTPDRVEEQREFIRRLAAGEAITSFETRRVTRDGRVLDVWMTVTKLVDDAGTPIGLASTERDISERKRAEESLLLKNLVFNASIAANSVADLSGTIMQANNAFLRLWGYSNNDEVVGRPLVDFISNEEEASAIINALNTGGAWEGEYTAKRKDLSIFIAKGMATVVRDERGNLVGYHSVVLDFTEYKRGQEALRVSEEKFSQAFQTLTYAITITRAEDGRFIEVNDAFTLIAGYTREEALADSSVGLKLWENEEDREGVVADLRAGRAVEGREYQFRTKSGKYITGLFSAQIIKLNSSTCILSSINDITESKQAERRIEHLNRVLRAVRKVTQLITREKDRNTLLRRACEILTETRGYRSAWIGLRLPDGSLRAVGESGIGEDFQAFQAQLERGELPECYNTAPGSADPVVMRNTIVNCVHCPLGKTYRDTAALTIRLRHAGFDYGFLVVALPDDLANDDQEQGLLKELAGDIGYALFSIEADQKHRQVEEKLRAEHSFTESLFDTAQAIILVLDTQGRIITYNNYMADISGYKLKDTKGKDWFSTFLPPGDNDQVRAIFKMSIGDIQTNRNINPIVLKDGRIKYIEWNDKTLKDSDGNVIGILAIGQDITERKRAEAQLKESEENFKSLMQQSPLVVELYDLNGLQISVNKAYEKLWDFPAETTLNKFNVLESKEVEETGLLEYVKRAYAGNSVDVPEYIFDPSGDTEAKGVGRKRWLSTKIYPLKDESGKVKNIVIVHQDITERKQAEEEILKLNTELEQRVAERTAQLDVANKELEAFAYSVSHDLRAPLRHIDGFVDMLQKKTRTSLDDQSRHYMDTISDSAKTMGTLIDDLLSFSHMGRDEMSKSQVDLNILVRDIIREFKPETDGRDIQWKISPLPLVTGDRAMLRVVLVNLISNALKFTRTGKTAEIEIGSEKKNEAETVFFVRDNGVGFDMHYVNKLFQVFQRLHRAEEFEGTGIGLANVRRVISRHGGRTWAEGRLNSGASFCFSLPQTQGEIS